MVTFAVTVRSSDAATTSVPVAWFDAPQRVHRWNKGASVVVAGAVVRRFYRAGGVTGSRTEIVAHAGYLWSAKKSVARELRRSAVAILELASADTQS